MATLSSGRSWGTVRSTTGSAIKRSCVICESLRPNKEIADFGGPNGRSPPQNRPEKVGAEALPTFLGGLGGGEGPLGFQNRRFPGPGGRGGLFYLVYFVGTELKMVTKRCYKRSPGLILVDLCATFEL